MNKESAKDGAAAGFAILANIDWNFDAVVARAIAVATLILVVGRLWKLVRNWKDKTEDDEL